MNSIEIVRRVWNTFLTKRQVCLSFFQCLPTRTRFLTYSLTLPVCFVLGWHSPFGLSLLGILANAVLGYLFCDAVFMLVGRLRYSPIKRTSHFSKAPLTNLMSVLGFFLPKKTNEHIVIPIVRDTWDEYFEALARRQKWKAQWVHFRGILSLFTALGLDRAFAFVSFFVKAWKSVN